MVLLSLATNACTWRKFLVYFFLLPSAVISLSSLPQTPPPPEKQRGSGVLSDISCLMGRGLQYKNVIVAFDIWASRWHGLVLYTARVELECPAI